jgi:fucose permease
MVGGLYAANLVGRLAASRLSRRVKALPLLVATLLLALGGVPVLLLARSAAVAGLGLTLLGAGGGAMFPLVSSLHLGASRLGSDGALGEVLSVAAVGQVLGPLLVAVVAQGTSLRVGLLALPALAVVALAGLTVHGVTIGAGDRADDPRSPGPAGLSGQTAGLRAARWVVNQSRASLAAADRVPGSSNR